MQEFETSKRESERLAEKYQSDQRRMRFLNGLLNRALQIGLGKSDSKLDDTEINVKPEDRKREFAELDSREKELLVSKMLKLLDSQLEVDSSDEASVSKINTPR